MDATATASEKTHQRSVTTGDLDKHNNSGHAQIISKCDTKSSGLRNTSHLHAEHDIAKLNEQLKTLDLLWKPNGRIEELPAEILFHIFKQLFDLKSVSNCYNTNLRWKKIVEEVFKNSKSKFSFYPYKVINN